MPHAHEPLTSSRMFSFRKGVNFNAKSARQDVSERHFAKKVVNINLLRVLTQACNVLRELSCAPVKYRYELCEAISAEHGRDGRS